MQRSFFTNKLKVTVALSALFVGYPAWANPTGGTVVGGQAVISTPSSNQLNVNQSTKVVIIDWKKFDIAKGETTTFIQPDASALAVNRIGGADPAKILGNLMANGKVILIDGNGFMFGPNAKVNVGALVATTSDASNADIMSGKAKFDKPGSANGQIINYGQITANSGMVGLVAPSVTNNGVIRAKLGQVALGASNVFTLDFTGDGLISFPVDPNVIAAAIDANGQPVKALVANNGHIEASSVVLSARAAAALVTNVISVKGEIVAQTISHKGGKIILDSGVGAVALEGAKLDASGANGGGSISVASVNASRVTADAATVLDASATSQGDGGSIVLNSLNTKFYGTASAKGGSISGNGGKIDTSGHVLDVAGAKISTVAPHGKTGEWLIDPYNIIISNDASTGSGYTATANDTVINADQILDALKNNSVSITTGASNAPGSQAGDITISTGLSWNSSNTLTLAAANSINVNAPISLASGGLSLTGKHLNFADNVTVSGAGSVVLTGSDYTFLGGHSLSFTGGKNSGATLAINGTSFTLLYGFDDIQAISSPGKLSGAYALANSLDASSLTTWTSIGDSYNDLPFAGIFEGLGHTVSNLSYTATKNTTGFFGYTSGATIRDFGLIDGAITSGNINAVGPLVGTAESSQLQNVFASTSVTGTGQYVGGLVGSISGDSNIINAAAFGDITGGQDVGGLVGTIYGGQILNAYATGSVKGGQNAGGLIGHAVSNSNATYIENTYASGAVSGDGVSGGLIGRVDNFCSTCIDQTTISNSYWNTDTANVTESIGSGTYTGNVFGVPTSVLQSGPAGLNALPWNIKSGANPYLSFLVLPQTTISGTVYSDHGKTTLSGVKVYEVLLGGSTIVANATSGNDGAYSVAAPQSNGTALLFLDGGSVFANTVAEYTGSSLSGVNLYGGYLTFFNTSSVTVTSALDSLKSFMKPDGFSTGDFLFSPWGDVIVPTAGLDITASRNLSADRAFSFVGTNGLYLTAGDALSIDAPLTVENGALNLTAYTMSSMANLTASGAAAVSLNVAVPASTVFGGGTSLSFTGGKSSGATLTINNSRYTLLYDFDDIQAINSPSKLDGAYALANSLDASSLTSWKPIGNAANSFSGVFEGLGHTVSNLSYTVAGSMSGFFGTVRNGIIRDFGLVGGTITVANGNSDIGPLAGEVANSLILNVYSSTDVKGNGWYVGGLIGFLDAGSRLYGGAAHGNVTGEQNVGGFAGGIYEAAVGNAYATGDVSASYRAGGFAGEVSRYQGSVAVSNVYASGAVSATDYKGGLFANVAEMCAPACTNVGIYFSNAYWTTDTTGVTNGMTGKGTYSGTLTGVTTAQLRAAGLDGMQPPGWVYKDGFNPYLRFETAPAKTISGTVYSDHGKTTLANANVYELTLGDSSVVANATSGTNGTYSLVAPDSNGSVLLFLDGGSVFANTVAEYKGASLSGVNLYGGYLTFYNTSSVTVAAALNTLAGAVTPNGVSARDFLFSSSGNNVAPMAGLDITATGDFSLDATLNFAGSNGLYLNVAGNFSSQELSALSIVDGALNISAKNIAIGSNVTVTGGGMVQLNTAQSGDYQFLNGHSLQFTGGKDAGASLSINGTAYTLLYSFDDLQAINATSNSRGGTYALAKSLDGHSFNGWTPIGGSNGGFNGVFTGLGNTVSNLSYGVTSVNAGFFGYVGNGVIRDFGVLGGTISGSADFVGGVVGYAWKATLKNVYSTASITADGSYHGGLIGFADTSTITNASARGSVSGAYVIGGLIGTLNESTLINAYATGPVTASKDTIGGLIGNVGAYFGSTTISNVYASGPVTAPSSAQNVGGLLGIGYGFGTKILTNAYWNSETSGTQLGLGSTASVYTGAAAGLTTAQLRQGPQGFDPSVWVFSNTANPRLIIENPIPTISGTVYTSRGGNALSGADVYEILIGNSSVAGTAKSGTDGSYSLFAPSSNGAVLLFLDGGNVFANAVVDYKGQSLSAIDLFGGYLSFYNTSAVTVSAALNTLSSFVRPDNFAAGDFLFNISGSSVMPTASLDITAAGPLTIDQALTFTGTNAGYFTAGNGDITVANAINLDSGRLILNATGAIAVNAKVSASGAATVSMVAGTKAGTLPWQTLTEISYGVGGGLDFGNTDNGAKLFVNRQAYKLVYSLDQLQAINSDLSGSYALATSLDGSARKSWTPIGNAANNFAGIFDGLGNTLSNLNWDMTGADEAGLFGVASGVLRNIGLVGGTMTGKGVNNFGPLAGHLSGVAYNSYSTVNVVGDGCDLCGGLIGYVELGSLAQNVFATGNVILKNGSESSAAGGLAGSVEGGISNGEAFGAVIGGSHAGSIAGYLPTSGVLNNVVGLGYVKADGVSGGLAGSAYGTITNGYFDSDTTGISYNRGVGEGQTTTGFIGLGTSYLQSNMPDGLTSPDWGFNLGAAYPYLASFFPNGVQTVSGKVYANSDQDAAPGLRVGALANGNKLGESGTGSNGYYYIFMPAGTLQNDSNVLAYLTGGTVQANTYLVKGDGALTDANLYVGDLRLISGAANLSTMFDGLASALGNMSGADYLFAVSNGKVALGSSTNLNVLETGFSLNIDQAITTTGNVVLSADDASVTQSEAIKANALVLRGVNTSFTLTNSANNVSILADRPVYGSLSFVNSGDLTIGTVADDSGLSGFRLISVKAGGNLTVDASVQAADVVSLLSGGDLTITESGSVYSRNSIVLSAGKAFVNNGGATAVTSEDGRWLIYSADPSKNSFGGLDSGNTAIWNATYDTMAPEGIEASGNRYLFVKQPTLTITTTDLSKTYGSSIGSALSDAYKIAGYDGGLTGVYLADTAASVFSGTPIISSLGAGAGAKAGSYTVNAAQGSIVLLNGYALSAQNNGVLTVDPKVLTAALTGVVTKIYDGTTAASLMNGNYVLSGIVGRDAVSVANTSGSFADKNAGSGKTITVSGLTLSGADAGNYVLSVTSVSGDIGAITPATLNAALTGSVTKVYDATTLAALANGNYVLTGVIGKDIVVLNNPASGSFDSKNVGQGKTITVNGLALSGEDAGNYVLGATTISGAIGGITPATLNAVLTGSVTKVYDGTTLATLGKGNYVLSGVIGSDGVVLNGPATGSFDTKNVANGKTITVTGVSIAGVDAANYVLAATTLSGALGAITPASLVLIANDATRQQGTPNPGFSYSVSGLMSGDNASVVGGVTASTSAVQGSPMGNYAITLSGGEASNYVIVSRKDGTLVITAPPANGDVPGYYNSVPATNTNANGSGTSSTSGTAPGPVGASPSSAPQQVVPGQTGAGGSIFCSVSNGSSTTETCSTNSARNDVRGKTKYAAEMKLQRRTEAEKPVSKKNNRKA
ncbi:filamentous hemagglutinin family protein [Rhizomicrobium palustre]|uniref:Filamentous hemagglutinin family protein n=1 Tax=Rhizomicrobium palustre TaxID=189966 RepID=A0A846N0S7_9PROT|nr:YDG domain-containing protein [Rhizomicrobium palustre]NIK89173.1 filamentous hemagglutinin family protein [Rhizomicrobium palustre]